MLEECSICCKCSIQLGDVVTFCIKFPKSTPRFRKKVHRGWQDTQQHFRETTRTKQNVGIVNHQHFVQCQLATLTSNNLWFLIKHIMHSRWQMWFCISEQKENDCRFIAHIATKMLFSLQWCNCRQPDWQTTFTRAKMK